MNNYFSLEYAKKLFENGFATVKILNSTGTPLDLDKTKITNSAGTVLEFTQIKVIPSEWLVSLVDTTNVAAATNYYPAATGALMDGAKDLSLTGILTDASTATISLQATNDEDAANANWVTIYGYDSKNNVVVNFIAGVASTTFAWDFDNLNYSRFRLKLVTGSSTNTIIVKAKIKTA